MSHFEGQIPGGVLKTIVQEHQFMDELVQLLRRRVDLDEKYNRDLAALCGTFNPKWKDSAIYPLFSPILTFFEKEVTTRRTTCESIGDILDEIPVTNSPDILEEGGSMLDEYQKLIEANQKLKECKEIASLKGSVVALQEWLNKEAPKSEYEQTGHFNTIMEWNGDTIDVFRIPEADRNYRRSVYLQQQIARRISKWHSNILPDILERHQDRSEHIKMSLQKVGNSLIEQTDGMVERLSKAKAGLNAFSSTDWITPKHEGQSSESNHEFIQAARYVNSITGKSSSVVIYGLDLEQVRFMEALRRKVDSLSKPKRYRRDDYYGEGRYHWHYGIWTTNRTRIETGITLVQYDDRNSLLAHCVPSTQHALDLEQRLGTDVDFNPEFNSLSRFDMFTMVSFYVLTNPPIVALSDEDTSRYHKAPYEAKPSSLLRRGPKPETKVQIMESILSRIPPGDRARVGDLLLLLRSKLLEDDDTIILTHSWGREVNGLVEDILKKWDFDLWCPFPAGLERRRDNDDWVVSKVDV